MAKLSKNTPTRNVASQKSKKKNISKKNISSHEKSTIENLSAEDFMANEFNQDDSDVSQSPTEESVVGSTRKRSKKINKQSEGSEESNDDSSDELDPTQHSKSLAKLKDTDPEFYAFLEENDKKLLNFKVDSDVSDEEPEEEGDDGTEKHSAHKPDSDLHEASDESDFEEEGAVISNRKITLKMVKSWQNALQSPNKIDLSTLSTIVKAFHAALQTVCSNEDSKEEKVFIIEGSGVFNAVIQLCVLYLQPAIKKILGLHKTNKDPKKCKRWIKIKSTLKSYFIDIFKLLGGVTSTNILTVLLKHLHQMSVFLGCFPILAKTLFKRLTILWSTSEETVRVLAFMCILRITRNNQAMLLENVLKMMYMTYVKSSKFVSPGTWPCILFMRRSLVEMFALDLNVSYSQVFLYIRQLAIHLRNAIVLHKKDNIQAVYNWQFVNSMHLWAELLTLTKNRPQLQSLVYPLVMIITNTLKLIPTAQYFPLRFHCVQILLNLSRDAEIFIPVLPFLLEVLTSYDFGKKNKKVSMKPMSFACVLRLSKGQLSENGFKDAVIDNIYALLLESLSVYSHTISFPDIVIPCIIQLKQFLKNCTVANYCKKIRQIVEKIEENSQFIEKERKKISFQINDIKMINAWETTIKNNGTPLQSYFDNWSKLNTMQKRKRANKNEILSEQLPTIKKFKKDNQNQEQVEKGPVDLFPSDSEDETYLHNVDDEPSAELTRPVKTKKVKKTDKQKQVQELEEMLDKDDVIEDFNISEW